MNLTLTRYGYTPMGTFGELYAGKRKFYTVERPWVDNRAMVSCVPEGEYDLLWKPTTTSVPDEYNGSTWYLEGETVSSGWSGKPRTRCAIHIANHHLQVNGCIGVGRQLGAYNDLWAVKASRASLLDLFTLIGAEDHHLTIKTAH